MKNPYLPAAAVAALIALALGWWATMGEDPVLPSAEVPEAVLPAEEGGTETGTGTPAAPSAETPSSSGVVIKNQTVLKTFSDPKWHFALSYDPTWGSSVTRAADNDIEQFSLESQDGTVFVSRETPIAEPAGLESSVSKRTIAGQEVSVTRYSKPNEKYAYYLFFTLSSGNYEYYVSIKSIDATSGFSDSVIRRITAK